MAEPGTHPSPPPPTTPARTGDDTADRESMRQLAAGDDRALDALMQRHAGPLTAYLERLLGNRDTAEDLAQESFVRLHQTRDRFNTNRAFAPWLYTIATNLARDHLRWRARHPNISLDHDTPERRGLKDSLPDPTHNPSAAAQRDELAATVRQAVLDLPEDLRTPLVLAEYQDQRVAEIAEVLGCSAKAVEMRLYRARLQLRDKLRHLCAAGC